MNLKVLCADINEALNDATLEVRACSLDHFKAAEYYRCSPQLIQVVKSGAPLWDINDAIKILSIKEERDAKIKTQQG